MAIGHVIGLFTEPKQAWMSLREANYSTGGCLAQHTLWFALIPAISGFVGTTQIGWQIGIGEAVKLTPGSAFPIAVLYYAAMVAAVFTVGYMTKWMGQTYGADQPLSQCIVLASYTATPLFLVGIMQLYPILWLNLIVGLPVLGYTVFLFYTGVPIMMQIPEERGFLFSTALLAFGMVALVAMLAVSVILWGTATELEFTN